MAGQVKKKHTAGAAKNFITRTQAVKKLQVSLADFRRLCIFKGIYPRVPRNKKKANKGSTANVTFYYAKDIQYLLHEPVLVKFREQKTFAKKLTRALGKYELDEAKRLDENRPRYTLDHIIKERYPSFMDAVRDIDDALSTLFLFQMMPASDEISHKVTQEADRLCNEWMAYVARERLLTKMFVSIKGVYYEANIKGEPVRWLVPFKFPQNIPTSVDLKIMLTFLEFYTTLLHFVLFRLYTERDLKYPPVIDTKKLRGVGGISAFILESHKKGLLEDIESHNEEDQSDLSAPQLALEKINEANNAEDEAEEEEDEDTALDTFEAIPSKVDSVSDILAQPKAKQEVNELFSKFVFYIGREVSLEIIEFALLAFGAKTIAEASIDLENPPDLSNVTHHICDRPTISHKVPGRTYIQPQWVFDSINKGHLLPVSDYAPGEQLPPHLSPWGDAAGYDPEADLSEGEEDEAEDIPLEDQVVGEIEPDQEEDEEDIEEREAQEDLKREAAGISFSEGPKKKKPAKKLSKKELAEQEEKNLKVMMLNNKKKRLYDRMQNIENKKTEHVEKLKQKKRKLKK